MIRFITNPGCAFEALPSRQQSACALLYCHLLPVRLYLILLHYLINGTIFEKKFLNIKFVFGFSLEFCLKDFLF